MAPKRPTPLEDPPSASSSEEEEEVASDDEMEEEAPNAETDDEEENDDEEEEEKEEVVAVNGAPAVSIVASRPAVLKNIAQRESSDSDESDDHPAVKKTVAQHESSESDKSDERPVLMKPKTSKTVNDEMAKKAGLKWETIVQKPMNPSADSDEKDGGQMDSITVKPIDAVKLKKESSKLGTTEEEKVVVNNVKKRKKSESEVVKGEDKKTMEDSKKQGHRVFGGESDEELLKGMVDFVAKNGQDFMADQDGFYEYVKKKVLDMEFSKSQLITKARNLKKKYKKNDVKIKNGEELKPREQLLYELSKKIWGDVVEKNVNSGGFDDSSKSNGQRKRVKKVQFIKDEKNEVVHDSEMDDVESDDASMTHLVKMLSKVDFDYGLKEELVMRGLSLIGKARRIEMVKQWEELLIDEHKLMLRHLELQGEQMKLTLDVSKAPSH